MIDARLHSAGVQEVRENLRSLLDLVYEGIPVAILQRGEIVAVMLDDDEVERCRQAEYAHASLHGLGIYPEAARDTSELASMVQEGREPPRSLIDEIANRPREIMAERASANASEFRHDILRYLERIKEGRTQTIVRERRLGVTVVSNREFARLGQLLRIMRWFEAGGLDLSKAGPKKIMAWVERRRRDAPASSEEGSRSQVASDSTREDGLPAGDQPSHRSDG